MGRNSLPVVFGSGSHAIHEESRVDRAGRAESRSRRCFDTDFLVVQRSAGNQPYEFGTDASKQAGKQQAMVGIDVAAIRYNESMPLTQ